jgi:hypothetical protein
MKSLVDGGLAHEILLEGLKISVPVGTIGGRVVAYLVLVLESTVRLRYARSSSRPRTVRQ